MSSTGQLLRDGVAWLTRIRDTEAGSPGVFPTTGPYASALLEEIERKREVLFMAATAAHEFARHGGDIERCVHHPCDLPEIKECVREKRERALADG